MKLFIIIHFLNLTIFTSCANSEKPVTDHSPMVLKAEYKNWNDDPVSDSDVRETGTDLTLQLKNWPQDFEPEYIIYNGRESFPASIAEQSEGVTKIKARIILRSSVMSETSEKSSLTDRLVFTDRGGNVNYIEIDRWERNEN